MRERSGSERHGGGRLAIAYPFILGSLAIVIVLSVRSGSHDRPAPPIAGVYDLRAGSPCTGSGSLQLKQSGQFVDAAGPGGFGGKLRLQDGRLAGETTCRDGSRERLDVPVPTDTRPETLEGTLAGTAFRAQFREELPPPGKSAKAVEKRSAEETFGRLMLAIAIVILGARLIGAGIGRIGQPRVMGEVLAGILLGPTLLGRFAPGIRDYLFPPDIIPLLSAGADIGLAFYMFLVGLELDPGMLRGRAEQAAFISHGSIAAPLALGFATAVPIFTLVGPHTKFLPFALFMGVAMSITAFPVLARILVERRMLKRPVGAMAMGAAAVDDVTAWGLLALAAGVARTGGFTVSLVRVVVLAIVFSAAMAVIGRRLLARVADAYDEVGRIPAGWIAAIFLGVLLSAYVSQQIGIAAIFGAFVMGMVMPRRADLTHDVSRRVEDFVTTVLLPLFFVVAGLKTDIGSLNRPVLWLLTLLLLAVAVIGKWAGAMSAARFAGLPWRESAALGLLMNTRGLTELIVLNIGLELGVVTPAIFTMLVIMALVTTFMAGPLLRLVDRRGEMAAPAEEELRSVAKATEAEVRAPVPERAFLVAPQDERNIEALLRIAEPMARSEPPRELILARLVVLSRGVTGIARDDHELSRAAAEIHARRDRLVAARVAARAVAFTSADPGEDLARLAAEQEVDLVLMDGQRPLLGEGVPRGAVGTVLAKAPCDVAVLVERDKSSPDIGPDFPVLVPFGGAEHDWAALELAAWIATSHGARLVLLGAAADLEEGRRDASRLLGDASLVVQQLTGIVAEPLLADPGREGIIRAAEGAGVLVIGLSDRWREEGLGPVRSTIARQAPSPTLFVRRGERAGALAPREDVTRFSWSMVAPMRRT